MKESEFSEFRDKVFAEMVVSQDAATPPSWLNEIKRPRPLINSIIEVLDDNGISGVIGTYDDVSETTTFVRGETKKFKLGKGKKVDLTEMISYFNEGVTMGGLNDNSVSGFNAYRSDKQNGNVMVPEQMSELNPDFVEGYNAAMREDGITNPGDIRLINIEGKLNYIQEMMESGKSLEASENLEFDEETDEVFLEGLENFDTIDLATCQFDTHEQSVKLMAGMLAGYKASEFAESNNDTDLVIDLSDEIFTEGFINYETIDLTKTNFKNKDETILLLDGMVEGLRKTDSFAESIEFEDNTDTEDDTDDDLEYSETIQKAFYSKKINKFEADQLATRNDQEFTESFISEKAKSEKDKDINKQTTIEEKLDVVFGKNS
jgi:hypothetical protein